MNVDFNGQKDNDEASFKSIYLDFYPGLLVFANGYVKEVEVAEDVLEDVFIKLWQNRNTICAIKNLKLYLYVAVKNSCYNYILKKKKSNLISIDEMELEIEAVAATAEESIISFERVALINAEIKKLPKKCQAIFVLIKEEGLKYSEVASLLNLSIKTVEAQMSIALRKLSSSFQSEFPASFIKRQQKKSV